MILSSLFDPGRLNVECERVVRCTRGRALATFENIETNRLLDVRGNGDALCYENRGGCYQREIDRNDFPKAFFLRHLRSRSGYIEIYTATSLNNNLGSIRRLSTFVLDFPQGISALKRSW
ncbi:hypothetical protein EVAR_102656_1 [Eumeta japonica]|uniref:Uncharacterized protein n=1 Tax=Eumeta variegata TaxID=151549 RepID=A0A4C1TUW4_EUMVA|nr:hypothetical protein EVAR_102656_1 [Eumeta japonica]